MTSTDGPVRHRRIEATPLGDAFAVRLEGLALRDIGAGSPRAAELRALLVDRKVLVFPDQHLTAEQLRAAGAAFGELTAAHPAMPPITDDLPEVLEIDATRSRTDARYRDEYEQDTWHTDVSFMPDPPLGSLLSGVVIPPSGGDTAFADLQAAYESPSCRTATGASSTGSRRSTTGGRSSPASCASGPAPWNGVSRSAELGPGARTPSCGSTPRAGGPASS